MALRDKYFTISEAAKGLGVTRQTISRWINNEFVPAEKIGRETLIKKTDLQKYLLERYTEAAKVSVMNLFKAIAENYYQEKGYLKEGEKVIASHTDRGITLKTKSHIPDEAIDEVISRFGGGFLQSLGIDTTKIKSSEEAIDEVKKRFVRGKFIQSLDTYTKKIKSPNNKKGEIRRERKKEK